MAQENGKFGAVAAGHEETARAAAEVLMAGGNAFDAAVAGMVTACVVEPVLASLGGGGFLLAREADKDGESVLYDFFTQTPKLKRPAQETEFYPVLADFGTATQEFHIGTGACATPGMVPGLSAVQDDLCRMDSQDHFAHAIALARDGVRVNEFQSFLFEVVSAIYTRDPASVVCYGDESGVLAPLGGLVRNQDLAATLETLATEGSRLFTHGDIAADICSFVEEFGGHLTAEDLSGYQVERRQPLTFTYRGAQIVTNPPPSTGGLLVAFALRLMERTSCGQQGGPELAHIMAATNRARIESGLRELRDEAYSTLLDADFLAAYETEILNRPFAPRGTTHISVVDTKGNAASVTLSNGEGCGRMLPGRGYMLNNMLGEEDINPLGLNAWPEDTRLCSMMSPSLIVEGDAAVTALGSGGSNRIRSAVLQVTSNILDRGLDIRSAIHAPRMHQENEVLNIEGPRKGHLVEELRQSVAESLYWETPNMFFGGVHAVRLALKNRVFDAQGDPRRGGHAVVC